MAISLQFVEKLSTFQQVAAYFKNNLVLHINCDIRLGTPQTREVKKHSLNQI